MTRKDILAIAAAIQAADAHAKGPFTIGYPDKAAQEAGQTAILAIRLAVYEHIRKSNNGGTKAAESFNRLSRARR